MKTFENKETKLRDGKNKLGYADFDMLRKCVEETKCRMIHKDIVEFNNYIESPK